jgi:hypothetical protein
VEHARFLLPSLIAEVAEVADFLLLRLPSLTSAAGFGSLVQ